MGVVLNPGGAQACTLQETTTLYSDASDTACRDFHPITGWFLGPQAEEHINHKEGLAVLQAIRTYNLRNVTIRIFTDSTTIMWYLRKWGEKFETELPHEATLARMSGREILLDPHWIPSKENPADGPSRVPHSPLTQSSLHPQVMGFIQDKFTHPWEGLVDTPFIPG